MSNPNQLITMTRSEKWTLEQKAKQGWKCYFISRDHIHQLQDVRDQLHSEVCKLKNNTAELNYDHLKQMFLTLYDKVGELCDCPVCFETLTKEKTSVPLCGHLVCKDCRSKMSECPVCRKLY